MRRLFVAFAVLILVSPVVHAEEFQIADWNIPGDGKTPTSLQYQDAQNIRVKPSKSLVGIGSRGDASWSFGIDLPPALLKPALSLGCTSSGEPNIEMTLGCAINGIAEIRRPLQRAFSDGGKDGLVKAEFLIQGPGFSGTLLPSGEDDWRYFLRSASPSYVTAKYSQSEDAWTLYHDGLTYTLKAADNGATESPDGTATWRVTEMQDTSGNYITYKYHDDGRIKKIFYGGNLITSESHLVRIDFTYAKNTYTRTSARAGFLTKYAYHLTQISVNTGHISESTIASDSSLTDATSAVVSSLFTATGSDSTMRYSIDLTTTTTDAVDLLTAIKRSGSGLPVETIATLAYTAPSSASTAERTSTTMVPTSLGATITESNSNDPTTSKTTLTLSDFNRDGLPDVIDSSKYATATNQWSVTNQKVDTSARTFSWGTDWTMAVGSGGALTQSSSGNAEREFIDFDGDGYLDLVVTDGYETGSSMKEALDGGGFYCDPACPTLWVVRYFDGNGYSVDDELNIPTGWRYFAESSTPQADAKDGSGSDMYPLGLTGVLTSRQKGFIDFNGDGWQDLYDPAEGQVWLNSGVRGGGFESPITLSYKFDGMSSVQYTVSSESFNPLSDSEYQNYCKDVCGVACEEAEEECKTGGGEDDSCEDMYSACEGDYCDDQLALCEQDCEDTASTCNDDCDSACSGQASEHQRQKYFSATDEIKALYDLNGDGLQDYVDASATTWQVYFNNGHDFEAPVDWVAPVASLRRVDEGRPNVEWTSAVTGTVSDKGTAATLIQALLDCNGDGLLDLAMGRSLGHVCYLNTGAGFLTTPSALPTWWPDNFMTSTSDVEVDADEGSSKATGATTAMVMDLDHDGVLDAVDQTSVSYGSYPKPYLLKSINNAQGGTTEIVYRSSNTVSPAGNFSKTQYMPIARDLVDEIKSTDAHTNQSSKTNFNYANGYYEDGVFWGFKTRDEKQTLNGDWLSHMQYEYELSRDLDPLPTSQKVYTDFNLNFSTNLSRGDVNKQLRYELATTYTDYGDTVDFLHLPKSKKVTEYGEGGGSGKSVNYSFSFDDYGNLKSATDDGGGDANNAILTSFTYVGDNAKDSKSTFWRIKNKDISGTDRLTGKVRSFSTEYYYYDGHSSTSDLITTGNLTKTETYAGWTANGETLSGTKLTMSYERGSRGELTKATDDATGITMNQTFGFGGAVLETQTNGLGQKLTRTIDEQGRITKIKDDNSLALDSTYDSFNRRTKTTGTGSDGKTYTLSDATYYNTVSPRYVKTQDYNTSGAVVSTAYALQDGFGETAQAWTQNSSGKFLVQNSLHDLRGLEIASTHPTVETSFSTSVSMTTGSSPFQLQRYDAFGAPRDITRDKALGLKNGAVYFENPWQQTSQDEKGYQTVLISDAHHRITEVKQGKPGSYVTTAKYKYDPLNRVVEFKDGVGTYYQYSYDGAGRLRKVSYGAAPSIVMSTTLGATSSSPTTWYTYEYTGALKTKMTDATGAYTSWDYDDLGRVEKVTMTDNLPKSTTGTLTYTYTYDTAWIGNPASTTDPLGTITYAYDKFGRVKQSSRTYTGGTSATTPKFSYLYDLQGNPTTITLPSGRKLTSTYKYGYLTKQSGSTLGTTDYTVNYTYNKWGLLSTAKNTTGLTFTNTYTTPLWLDKIKAGDSTTSTAFSYKWLDNSLLSKRTATITAATSALSSTSAYTYSYDDLRELTKIASALKTIESYTYDDAGNPETITDVNGVSWTYDAAGTLNQIAKRTSDTGLTESYTFDAAGRTATSTNAKGTTTYYYDGSGRLRGTANDGIVNMVIDYDSDGNVARRADGNPFATTPNYIYSFGNWRYDTKNAKYTESDNGFVATQNGSRTWLMRDYDSHVVATFDDKGTNQSRSDLGAYGAVVSETGTPWELNSFHGQEDQGDFFHMGQRHLMQKDGTWLQPEPLLYTGLKSELMTDPLSLATRRYARNTPTVLKDPTGMAAYDINVAGDNVTITHRVQFTGDAASPKNVEGYKSSIETNWSGFFGKLNVRTRVVLVGDETSVDNKTIVETSTKTGRAFTSSAAERDAGRSVVTLYGGYQPKILAHEFGHVMGLNDKYDYHTGAPMPGEEHEIMANSQHGSATANDIKEIISVNTSSVGSLINSLLGGSHVAAGAFDDFVYGTTMPSAGEVQ